MHTLLTCLSGRSSFRLSSDRSSVSAKDFSDKQQEGKPHPDRQHVESCLGLHQVDGWRKVICPTTFLLGYSLLSQVGDHSRLLHVAQSVE